MFKFGLGIRERSSKRRPRVLFRPASRLLASGRISTEPCNAHTGDADAESVRIVMTRDGWEVIVGELNTYNNKFVDGE